MTIRVILGSFALICAVEVSAFPAELEGTWEETFVGDVGPMTVSIQDFDGMNAAGFIHIQNSRHCPARIPFRGKLLDGKRMQIESSAEIVCGYAGKLTGEVVGEAGDTYTGSFQYRYLRVTWARGTFRMKPPTINTK